MKVNILCLFFALFIVGCKSKSVDESIEEVSDSLALKPVIEAPSENSKETYAFAKDAILYEGAVANDIRSSLESFSPLSEVLAKSIAAAQIRDSLMNLRNYEMLTVEDSAVYSRAENIAYQAIEKYKNAIEAGFSLPGSYSLLQLTRTAPPGDSSVVYVGPSKKSTFFSQNILFLGGAPFLEKRRMDDGRIFVNEKGEPETRLICKITENVSYALTLLFATKHPTTKISFGPPQHARDIGPISIRGIGSLVHTFLSPQQAFLITEKGLVRAELSSVTVKLFPIYAGCETDLPIIEFKSSVNLYEDEVLAIYVPLGRSEPTSCIISRKNHSVWTADLDGDGNADLACYSETFEGISSDNMNEVIWFANISGTWKIIDWGVQPDCT